MMQKPNIIFIFTDQHRKDSLGCYGNDICRTPNLDRLAKEGVLFENAYTTCPVCTPARASIQTGLYPTKHGMQTNIFNHGCMMHELPDTSTLLSRRLQAAGYRAGYTGKWHLGYGWPARNDPYYQENYQRIEGVLHNTELPLEYKKTTSLPTTLGYEGDDFPGHGGGGQGYPQFQEYLKENGLKHELADPSQKGEGEVVSGTESTVAHFLTERAFHHLENLRKGNEPFFFALNYWGPHNPAYVPTEFLDLYRDLSLPPWASFYEDQTHKPRTHNVKRTKKPWEQFEESLRYYYAFVSLIDYELGRLLAYLDETGLADNTIIIFTADHGDSMGVHNGLTDKSFFCYEETASIPMIIRPAGGLEQGRDESAFANLTDVYSTILDYAGDDREFEQIDGRSLRPLVEGDKPADWPETVVTETAGLGNCTTTQRMCRKGNFKYVFNFGDLEELYDFQSDPHEMENLAVKPEYNDRLQSMRVALEHWMEEHGDRFLGQYKAYMQE